VLFRSTLDIESPSPREAGRGWREAPGEGPSPSRAHLQPQRLAAEQRERENREASGQRRQVQLVDLLALRRGQPRLLQLVDAIEHLSHGTRVGGAEVLAAGG